MNSFNEFRFEWNYDPKSEADCYAECTLRYIPEENGHGAHPDEPESVELLDVLIGNQSIFAILSEDQVLQIEALALEKHGADAKEAHDDRRIERYLDRQAEESF